MKLAYFSPLNPQPSGISDYSEELLPYLATDAEITLFVDGFKPSNPEIRAQFSYYDYRRNPAVLQALRDHDAIVYHMGNDHRYHGGMLAVAREHPGIIVFHDFALQDFFLGLARARGRPEIYLEEVAACHGYDATRAAAEALARGNMPALLARPTDFPLNCRLAREAEGIIVHSEWGRDRFLRVAPSVPLAHINMPIKPLPAGCSPDGRQAEDHAAGLVEIANFGLITPGKGIEKALRALSSLKSDYNFHYTLVGDPNSYFDVRALVRRYDMEDRFSITGHVRLEEFERRIAQTDIALNLRERTVGETSASLCRIMAAGVPAIVFNVGAFSELPGDAVVKINLDHHADALLQSYLRRLIEDRSLRKRIGENASRYIRENHDIKKGAASYLAFVAQVIARRARRHLVNNVAAELSLLGIGAQDNAVLRTVAEEVTALMPDEFGFSLSTSAERIPISPLNFVHDETLVSDNGHSTAQATPSDSRARTPKVDGIDYKQAAVDYLGEISEERQHHLRTKPFYNLRNKPAKYKGEGMDADMHRHFCDFANIAVELALQPGAKILDVGCGSGWLSEYFARLGYDVKGIDISPALIAMSRERVARVPYGVDHETPLHCEFEVHDIELAPLQEKFDALICYDSLHHLEDERAVFTHLAAMVDVGGLMFILEGQKPPAGSETEAELLGVMREFGTLESPFGADYLRKLISDNGFAIVGDYVSVNGLFEREMLDEDSLPLRTLAIDYHYLTCMKVTDGAPATSVPDSREPGVLRAEFRLRGALPQHIKSGEQLNLAVAVKNAGDTLWLSGQTVRRGVVMPGVRIIDARGRVVTELHGQPMLAHAVPPGVTADLDIQLVAPIEPGNYMVKIDLVDQHVCWFEERGSQPLVVSFQVRGQNE